MVEDNWPLRRAAERFQVSPTTAQHEAAEAVATADKLAKVAKDPADMSLDDIVAFNHTMEKYRDDPLFAEQFAKRLGAKGTLRFWAEMSYNHAGARGSELQTMKDLQANLGLTLATASFSDSDAMKGWKKALIAESNTNFRAQASPNPVGALGSSRRTRERGSRAPTTCGSRDTTASIWSSVTMTVAIR
ncbi:hypothetical protein [Streptomyces actuosus]|uniref:hypothetical protein n=1 Tax=Streptomyces actuosus TaxID=1885 RepID=UPI003F68926F